MRVSWPRTGLSIASSSERAGLHSDRGRTMSSLPTLSRPQNNLELMAIGVCELDRNLPAGSAPAVKVDRDVVLLQMVPHPQ